MGDVSRTQRDPPPRSSHPEPTVSTSSRLDRRAVAAVALAIALLLTLLPTPGTSAAHADGSAEARLVSLLNSHRAAAGKAPLSVAGDLASVARNHSQQMGSGSNLHHNPNLGGQVSGWQKVGENVGRGPSADAIHGGWVGSGSHNANMLDGSWTEVGIGVVVVDGQVWATQVFRQRASAPPPEPEPEPAPAPLAPAPSSSEGSADEGGSSAGEPAAPAPSSTDAASHGSSGAQAPPEPEPEPIELEPHEVPEIAASSDRLTLVLARLEARAG